MSEINFDFKKMYPFKWFILENYPFLEDSVDTLTNYQLFCKLGEEINKNRDAINDIGDNQEQVVEGYNILYHWFENLDVQEEINNKLDEMVDTGELTTLIGNYIQPLIDDQNENIENFKTQTNNQITTQNQNISNLQNSTSASITNMQTQLNSIASGSPLVASSTSGMTDTSRVYVNTTDGKWYYYDGTSWTVGGTYQSSGLSNGSVTLNILGNDVLFNLDTRINDVEKLNYNDKITLNLSNNLLRKSIGSNGQIGTDSDTRVITNNLIYIPTGTLLNVTKNTDNYDIRCYFYDKNFNFIQQTFISQINVSSNLLFALPFDYKYIRFRFAQYDQTVEITIQNVLDNVELTFEENKLLKKSPYIKGNNLLNSANYLTGYINSGNYPFTRTVVGTYNSTIIPIEKGITYFINNFRKFALYDENMMYIANSFIDSNTNSYTFEASTDGFLAISWNSPNNFIVKGTTGSYTPYTESLPNYVQITNIDNLSDLIDATNLLVGKKYTALGDSFTHGDFSDSPTDDYTITDGTYAGEYKVYPFIIGNRNNMVINNLATNGMTLTNINSSSTNYLSNDILANIPNDTDYITIKIGINDDHQNAPIGNIDDNISSTFYGSWNRVMNYLITNYPNAKIGIIVSNGISNVDYINASINIAKKYGISYINESTDDRVPLLIRTLRDDVSSDIKTLRNQQWEVYPPSNAHPNAKCHEYESTIIENFLRTL